MFSPSYFATTYFASAYFADDLIFTIGSTPDWTQTLTVIVGTGSDAVPDPFQTLSMISGPDVSFTTTLAGPQPDPIRTLSVQL